MHPDYIAFQVWYADGHSETDRDGVWSQIGARDVQFVTFYLNRTYQMYQPGIPDETGNPTEGTWITEHYVEQFHSADYYWLDADGRPHAGNAADVPDGLPDGSLKTGSWLDTQAYSDLVAKVQQVRVPL